MSKNEDDEFKDIVKGLPSENTTQRSVFNLTLPFIAAAALLVVCVVAFGGMMVDQMQDLSSSVPQQMLINGLLSVLLGGIQAWVFRSKIRSRPLVFVAFSLMGGLIGGLVGGLMINSGLIQPVVIGIINGFLSGGISSLAQNRMMANKKYGTRWFLYNIFSWPVIFAVAWSIAWQSTNIIILAAAGIFVVIASGIGLVIFLRGSPQIEFS